MIKHAIALAAVAGALPAIRAAETASFAAPHMEPLGIHVFTAGSEEFASALKRWFAQTPPELGTSGPFAVLIENRSSLHLVALTMRYEFGWENRQPTAHVARWSNLGPTLWNHGLGPGGAALVSPNGVVVAPKAPTGGTFTGGGAVQSPFAESASVTVRVDSILFADGRFAGEDRSRTLEELSNQAATELRISHMLLAAPEGADLLAVLTSAQGARHHDLTDIPGMHQRFAVNAYLARFRFSGREGVLEMARQADGYYRALNLRKVAM